jgi:hypothetical protein
MITWAVKVPILDWMEIIIAVYTEKKRVAIYTSYYCNNQT